MEMRNNMTTQTEQFVKVWLTSDCQCTDYDEESGDEKQAEQCNGYCWEWQAEDFMENTKEFFGNTQFERQFLLYNFPTWMGGRDGEIWVKNAKDFLYKFFGNLGDFSAKCDIYSDKILISIGHHDGRGVCRIAKGDPELER